jgi:hypothetical protein
MRDITERTILLRGRAELPAGLKLVTAEFQEGWNIVQSEDMHRLDKEIRKRGWHFIWIAEVSLRSGVGQTSQGAIASALKLALRCVSERFNAAEVEGIELTHYPWFFLAKVSVYPFQIQQNPDLSLPAAPRHSRTPHPASALSLVGNPIPTTFSRGITLSR